MWNAGDSGGTGPHGMNDFAESIKKFRATFAQNHENRKISKKEHNKPIVRPRRWCIIIGVTRGHAAPCERRCEI